MAAERSPVVETAALTAEQQAEVGRLQHGITVLDLFDREVQQEQRREDFLRQTAPDSDSREAILQSTAYGGDAVKLEMARAKMHHRYAIHDTQRQAMLKHAGFIGIPAVLRGKQMMADNPADQDTLELEHGKWRAAFASHNRTAQRGDYREFLQAKIRSITGETDTSEVKPSDQLEVVVGPHVNLEQRAIHFTKAINAMAHRSMLSGLNVAVKDERYNKPIFERYEERTPYLDLASQKKYERLLGEARHDVWLASGYPAIRAQGVMKEVLLRRRSQKMWREFAGQFEHPPQQFLRMKVRKQLGKFITKSRLPETKLK